MSSDEQDDDITILLPHHSEYAASEPGSSQQRIKTGRTSLLKAERLHHDAIEHLNVDPIGILTNTSTEKTYI